MIFEDVPPPGTPAAEEPVVRPPRRPPPPEETSASALDAPLASPAGPPKIETWDDVLRALPKDQAGNPDWSAAVQEKIVAPRSALDPHAAESETISLDALEAQTAVPDIELAARSARAFDVTFSHAKHGDWLTCSNCHPSRFAKKVGATPMTPEDVHSRKYCAACHGTVAFDIGPSCMSCHLRTMPRDTQGQIDWSRALVEKRIAPGPGPRAAEQEILDLDVTMVPVRQPALKSVFSHARHTPWVACASCHPSRWEKKTRQATGDTEEQHSSRYCGACHGTVSFGITGSCGRCHEALERPRQHQESLDLDVAVTPRPETGGASVLSHKQHRWVECATCHTNLFTGVPGATTMPKSDIYGGKYCANCHGKVTENLTASCRRCHGGGGAP